MPTILDNNQLNASGQTFVESLMGQGGGVPAAQPITDDKIIEWAKILGEYASGKKALEERVKANQEYWKLRHSVSDNQRMNQASAWLTNVVLGKHAARTDAYPEATVLPREQSDETEAQNLTDIIPAVLDLANFRKAYSQVGWDKEISCSGFYFVGWDASAHNGLGEVSIKAVDLMNLFWQPGITDIQESRYLFAVTLVDTEVLQEKYPGVDFGSEKVIEPSKYFTDDTIDVSHKDAVVDVYYKKTNAEGKQVLHFATFTRRTILYATENDPNLAERGLYDHGKYPFVVENLYPVKGSICGFGYVDICRNPQWFIDELGTSILENAQYNSAPRFWARDNMGINEADFANPKVRIVKYSGDVNAILPFQQTALQGNILSFYQSKIDEMKQTAGNRDAANGGTEGGATAASALAIMQEAGNALSKDENASAYDAFKDVVKLVIELIRQFYDVTRFFRIMGEKGAYEFIQYTNAKLVMQQSMGINGEEYFRLPEFDLQVEASEDSDYSRQSQNNLAIQLYGAGFFNPMNAPMVIPCLEMMSFHGKDKMIRMIAEMAASMPAQPAQEGSQGAGTGSEGNNANGNQSTPEAAQERAEKKKAQAENANKEGVTPN